MYYTKNSVYSTIFHENQLAATYHLYSLWTIILKHCTHKVLYMTWDVWFYTFSVHWKTETYSDNLKYNTGKGVKIADI